MQEQLRIHRQILYDLALHYLEPLPGSFARLAYLAGLKNASTEIYEHSQLAAAFGTQPVHEALAKCHAELFERLLELPLAGQEEDLRWYLASLPGGVPGILQKSREPFFAWVPSQAPDYLKELFRSNLSALFELLHEGKSRAHSGK